MRVTPGCGVATCGLALPKMSARVHEDGEREDRTRIALTSRSSSRSVTHFERSGSAASGRCAAIAGLDRQRVARRIPRRSAIPAGAVADEARAGCAARRRRLPDRAPDAGRCAAGPTARQDHEVCAAAGTPRACADAGESYHCGALASGAGARAAHVGPTRCRSRVFVGDDLVERILQHLLREKAATPAIGPPTARRRSTRCRSRRRIRTRSFCVSCARSTSPAITMRAAAPGCGSSRCWRCRGRS